MRDLAKELIRQGHEPLVITSSVTVSGLWASERIDGVEVLRVAAPAMKDVGRLRRLISELTLPFRMISAIRSSPHNHTKWELVVWYSPTIFFGPLILFFKRKHNSYSYLILRDIFPEWAYDLGLLNKGLAYAMLKLVANSQYAVADTIGVQTQSNLVYLSQWEKPYRRLEVLNNWLEPAPNVGSTISVASTTLVGRSIFVYVGNMGVAQGVDVFLDLAETLRHRQDIGFLFVGRGTELARLNTSARARALNNTLFFDSIDPKEIPGLLAQCRVGLIALDLRHKTHNIPGKFLTYLNAGLPTLARINKGTDLGEIIKAEEVGVAFSGHSLGDLARLAEDLVDNNELWLGMSAKCRKLGANSYSPSVVARQIVAAVKRL